MITGGTLPDRCLDRIAQLLQFKCQFLLVIIGEIGVGDHNQRQASPKTLQNGSGA